MTIQDHKHTEWSPTVFEIETERKKFAWKKVQNEGPTSGKLPSCTVTVLYGVTTRSHWVAEQRGPRLDSDATGIHSFKARFELSNLNWKG